MNGASYEWSQRVADFDRANMKINERSGDPNGAIAATKQHVYSDTSLMTLLREWYWNKGIPPVEKGDFDDWLETVLIYLFGSVPNPTPESIHEAARFAAIGVLQIGARMGPAEAFIPADGEIKEGN